MHLQGYHVLMVQYKYMSAMERDDVGTAGVLMGGGNNYSSGLFHLLAGVYCDWKLSWLRVPCCVVVCVLVLYQMLSYLLYPGYRVLVGLFGSGALSTESRGSTS